MVPEIVLITCSLGKKKGICLSRKYSIANTLITSVGSRDGSISLWCVQDPASQTEDNELNLCIKSPANRLYSTLDQEKGKDKIRDMVYERNLLVK